MDSPSYDGVESPCGIWIFHSLGRLGLAKAMLVSLQALALMCDANSACTHLISRTTAFGLPAL